MPDVMNGSQVSAPPPMAVTFAEDYPGGDIRLVEDAWPARLLVSRDLVDLARLGLTRCVTCEAPDGMSCGTAVLRFVLANASATYSHVETDEGEYGGGVYLFDCVAYSRDVPHA